MAIDEIINEIGCFKLINLENEFGNYSFISQEQMNRKKCIQNCSLTGHKYAILINR